MVESEIWGREAEEQQESVRGRRGESNESWLLKMAASTGAPVGQERGQETNATTASSSTIHAATPFSTLCKRIVIQRNHVQIIISHLIPFGFPATHLLPNP